MSEVEQKTTPEAEQKSSGKKTLKDKISEIWPSLINMSLRRVKIDFDRISDGVTYAMITFNKDGSTWDKLIKIKILNIVLKYLRKKNVEIIWVVAKTKKYDNPGKYKWIYSPVKYLLNYATKDDSLFICCNNIEIHLISNLFEQIKSIQFRYIYVKWRNATPDDLQFIADVTKSTIFHSSNKLFIKFES